MPTKIDRSRHIFSMLKIGRGESITVATATDAICLWAHWTNAGPRLCHRRNITGATCQHCGSHTPGARQMIYLPAAEAHHDRPKLLILSILAVHWADEVSDLQSRTLTIERARRNNLIRARDEGPSRWHVPATHLTNWLATLFGTDLHDIKASR